MRRFLLACLIVLASAVSASAQTRPATLVPTNPTFNQGIFNKVCFDQANKDVYTARVGTNDWGVYTGATNCATGSLRFDVSDKAARIYNTYTSSTSYEAGILGVVSNEVVIGSDKGTGGGTARAVRIWSLANDFCITDDVKARQVCFDNSALYSFNSGSRNLGSAANTWGKLFLANGAANGPSLVLTDTGAGFYRSNTAGRIGVSDGTNQVGEFYTAQSGGATLAMNGGFFAGSSTVSGVFPGSGAILVRNAATCTQVRSGCFIIDPNGSGNWSGSGNDFIGSSSGTGYAGHVPNAWGGDLIHIMRANSSSPAVSIYKVSGTGKPTITNEITLAGQGYPLIVSAPAITATQTANVTVITYTPPSAVGHYRLNAVITSTSGTNTGTVQTTVDYVDSQGTTHTADIIFLCGANVACAATQTGASKEWHMQPWEITTNNAGSNIVLKVVITGSVNYTVTGFIEKIV